MGPSTGTGSAGAFTLLELLVVISILGILLTMAQPMYQHSVRRAREATLREDLFVLRDCLDQFYTDHGGYPETLEELVTEGYVRRIPRDPFTGSPDTWALAYVDNDDGTRGAFDVHSGSDLAALDSSPLTTW